MLENCSALDPWLYRSDSAWISQAFAGENQAITRALQISLSDAASPSAAKSSASPFLLHHSQHRHAPAACPLRPLGAAPSGRVYKRRSRAAKQLATTYINADPANFKEMVQRVTGVWPVDCGMLAADPANFREMVQRLTGFRPVDCGMLAADPMVRWEPVRPAVDDRAALRQMALSTLDTSALLLDCVAVPPDGDGVSVGPSDHLPDFDLGGLVLPDFPSLESWDAI